MLGQVFMTVAGFVNNVANDCYGNVFVPRLLGDFFRNAASWFLDLYLATTYGATWYQNTIDMFTQFVQALDVPNIMNTWIQMVNQLWSWFTSWVSGVTDIIGSWWGGVQWTVRSWIEAAVSGFNAALNNLQYWVDDIRMSWGNFVSGTLPGLVTGGIVQQLIAGALMPWAGLFNFWGEFSHDMGAFFTNPLEFVWNKFNDWFFGG